MIRFAPRCSVIFCAALCCGVWQWNSTAGAQFAGGNGGAGGQQGGTGGQLGGGGGAGIVIDTEGIVHSTASKTMSKKLAQQRLAAVARRHLSADLNTYSPLRKVSLVLLEAACEHFAETNKHVPDEMQYLAGLQRIDFVFVYPKTKNIVIAGPAEGFAENGVGRAVGITTGRPPLRLDDLIVVLRALEQGDSLGCSIDARPENLAKLKRFQSRNSRPSTTTVARARFKKMADLLGMQDVTIWGVPPDSHFARTLLEADFRMKQVSMGLERTGVRGLKTHLSMIRPGDNMAQRWWFTPMFDSFVGSKDGNAYQLAGQRAQLLAENEVIDSGGRRIGVGMQQASTQAYARHFTEKFPQLAEAMPVFAELQNLIDLVVVASLLKKERLAEQVGWDKSLFLDESRTPLAKWNVPRQVPTSLNFQLYRRRMLLGLVGGGVIIAPSGVVEQLQWRSDEEGKLAATRSEAASTAQHWWWD